MQSFRCPSCEQLLFFANSRCTSCATEVAVDPDRRAMVAVGPDRPRCADATVAACNWTAPVAGERCISCATTRTRPADDDAEGLAAWADVERAKRHLLFQVLGLGLAFDDLAFDLLSSAHGPVTTGHADGVVTLDLAESDDAHRVGERERLGEPYRTVLGHLRHEVGHYFWMTLIDRAGRHDACRAVFGDDRADYADALEAHYASEPPADWQDRFVSTYATAHPWEDWAETFAHVLHIRDTLETAAAYGVTVAGPKGSGPGWWSSPVAAVAEDEAGGTFRDLLDDWFPLTYTLNAINRSMGADDLYPFVLSPAVIDKLAFVDRVIADAVA